MITAGYVARIPVPAFSKDAKRLMEAQAIATYEGNQSKSEVRFAIQSIDKIVFAEIGMSKSTISDIKDFVGDIIRRT